MKKPRIATTSLCGCFGCHMSLLDIDERILALVDLVEFDRSPIDDIKRITGPVDIGLVEGGCANEDNLRVLREFREHCRVLVAIGDCAINGGVPAMRNPIPLAECFREAYLDGPSLYAPSAAIPEDVEIPALLDKVTPCSEIVPIDFHLPGCPPSADALWELLQQLLAGQEPELAYELIKYD